MENLNERYLLYKFGMRVCLGGTGKDVAVLRIHSKNCQSCENEKDWISFHKSRQEVSTQDSFLLLNRLAKQVTEWDVYETMMLWFCLGVRSNSRAKQQCTSTTFKRKKSHETCRGK